MSDKKDNPLVAALPPETDYLTYLTVVEYNLDKDQLPLLHDLLQDTKLTANIGWDLVHLLLPLLPESDKCLQDVSFLGNPRETVLKVAELLEKLGQPDDSDTEEGPVVEDSGAPDSDEEDEKDDAQVTQEETESIDLLALQFHSLLHMLCVLHPRIETKNPSRFLTTSLQAVITAYRNLQKSTEEPQERLQSTTRAVLMLIKSMSGSKRPHLPPRRSQSAIPSVSKREAAPDPERTNDESTAPGETELKKQILQSFVTHVLEVYVQSLEPIGMIDSALAWSTRHHEKTNPVPGKPKFEELFEVEEELERAEATIQQLLSSIEGDLQLTWNDLLHDTIDEINHDDSHKSIFTLQDFPASRTGSLYALAAKAATCALNDRTVPFEMAVFPGHSILTELFVDDLSNDIDGDAITILGKVAYDTNELGDWETRAEFNQYLQRLSQLAASSGIPNVATQASELISTVLHAHPSSDARLDFILDTLEDCPYPELKEAAVLWLKDEISAVFHSKSTKTSEENSKPEEPSFGETSNVFTHPENLKQVAPLLFAEPVTDEKQEPSPAVRAKFWLAALNLYYLLCAQDELYDVLEVQTLNREFKIDKDFVAGLRGLVAQHKDDTGSGSQEGYHPYIPMIEDALTRLKTVQERRAVT